MSYLSSLRQGFNDGVRQGFNFIGKYVGAGNLGDKLTQEVISDSAAAKTLAVGSLGLSAAGCAYPFHNTHFQRDTTPTDGEYGVVRDIFVKANTPFGAVGVVEERDATGKLVERHVVRSWVGGRMVVLNDTNVDDAVDSIYVEGGLFGGFSEKSIQRGPGNEQQFREADAYFREQKSRFQSYIGRVNSRRSGKKKR